MTDNGSTIVVDTHGGLVYTVSKSSGDVSSIKWNGTTYIRHNAFSFSATSPFTVTPWNPYANGKVNSVAFNGSNCSVAFLGGNFSWVHGSPAKYFAAVNTSTGALVGSIGHSADAQVETIVSRGGHLLVGGYFRSINGTARDYFASLNPTTGRDDGFLHLHISGNYRYCAGRTVIKCSSSNLTRVYNQQLSHTAHTELVEGDFTTAGGQSRQHHSASRRVAGRRSFAVRATHPLGCAVRIRLSRDFYGRDRGQSSGGTAPHLRVLW